MANLTIRKLDDAIRDELRLRAARNGRSVEDEVRVILREASQGGHKSAAGLPQELLRFLVVCARGRVCFLWLTCGKYRLKFP